MQHHTSSWTQDVVRNHHFPARRDRETIRVSQLHVRRAQVVGIFCKAPWTGVLFASAVEREELSVEDPCLRSVCATVVVGPTLSRVAVDGFHQRRGLSSLSSLPFASGSLWPFLPPLRLSPSNLAGCSCQSSSFISRFSGLWLSLQSFAAWPGRPLTKHHSPLPLPTASTSTGLGPALLYSDSTPRPPSSKTRLNWRNFDMFWRTTRCFPFAGACHQSDHVPH